MLTALTQRLRRVTNGKPWLPEIDGLRFIAILGVVLFHMSGEIQERSGHLVAVEHRYWLPSFLIGNGDRGVRLFFVISGLVLALPFARQFLLGGRAVQIRNYYMRRVTRLEPPYLASILLFAIGIRMYAHSFPAGYGWHALATVFYLHEAVFGFVSPLNMISWSLEVEVQFYLAAPLIMQLFRIADKRLRRMTFVLLILLSTPLAYMTRFSPRLGLVYYLGYFFAGLLVADIFVTEMPMWRERWSWDAAAVVCLLFAIAMPHDSALAHALLPLAFGILCLCAMRGPILRSVVSTPWIAVIGGMCYSIYLTHMIAIPVAFKVSRSLMWHRLDFAGMFITQGLILLPATMAVSIAFYLLIERPCMDPQWPLKLKQWIMSRAGSAAASTRS
jgi:peptidoglycan/LPS O-acetylase OafA/YrhL